MAKEVLKKIPTGAIIYITTSVAGVLLAGEVLTGGEVSWTAQRWLDNLRPRPTDPVWPGEQDQVPENNQQFHAQLLDAIDSYKKLIDGYGSNLQWMMEQLQPQQVISTIDNINQNSLAQGINILELAWLFGASQDLPNINWRTSTLTVDGETYNLGNKFDEQLARSQVDSKIRLLGARLALSQPYSQEQEKDQSSLLKAQRARLADEADQFKQDVAMLSWLKRSRPPIVMSADSFAFLPRYEMVKIARMFKLLKDHGWWDVVRKIRWCGVDCVGDDKFAGTADKYGKIYLENNQQAGGLAHELGHLIYNKDDGKLLKEFSAVRGYTGTAPMEDRLKHVSEYAMKNAREDFSETFEKYVLDCDTFRGMIAELTARKPELAQALERKYQFMKEAVFAGDEFSADAEPRNYDQEAKVALYTGFSWDAVRHILGFKPNIDPAIFPDGKNIRLKFPILSGDDDTDYNFVLVDFRYDESKRRYTVVLYNGALIDLVIFEPITGDERIMVSAADSNGKKASNNILPVSGLSLTKDIFQGSNHHEIKITSLTKIEKGQKRYVADQDRYEPIPTRSDPATIEPNAVGIYDGNVIEIINGPVSAFYPYLGQEVNWWKVVYHFRYYDRNGELKTASRETWLAETWVGRELTQPDVDKFNQQ